MSERESAAAVFLLSLVPYAAVAWGWAHFTGLDNSFWQALAFLFIVRLFFGFIEISGGVLIWRLHGRKRVVAKFVEYLKSNEFPKRIYANDDFLNYLVRVEEDEQLSLEVRKAAKELESQLALYETMGILLGARMHTAAELALEIHSPRALAPQFLL